MVGKLTLSLLFALSLSTAEAQTRNRQIVLIEEFTNSGCGPCANYSPTLDSVTSYRLGEVISIKYHGNYPDKSDPFYLDQKTDLDKRIAYYNITAYPTNVINGITAGSGMAAATLNGIIDKMLTMERNYDILLQTSVADHTLTATASVTPTKDVADASNVRLYIVPIEEYYRSATAYANGEHEMRYTMRRMLPDADGHSLGASLKAGTAYTYTASCSLSNFYNEDQMGVVAFLQDTGTKSILATTYVPRKANGTDNLCLMNVENTPDNICIPNYYGKITFRNNGSNTVKSATLNISINGKVTQRQWTGSLEYLDKATLDFSDVTDFSLSTSSSNSVRIWLSDVNGTANKSNEMTKTLHSSVQAEGSVQLKIYTDNKPEETTWKLFNSAGDVVQQGGPYTGKRTFYTEDLKANADDCYSLELYDAGGDGIKGSYGNGYYQFFQVDANGNKTRLTQGDYDGSILIIDFNLKNAIPAGIDDIVATADGTCKATVYDLQGRILGTTTVREISNGSLKGYGRSTLILSISTDNGQSIKKVCVE